MSDNLYRFCVFCAADCHLDEPDHAEDCPENTGVWPVREEDFGPKCFHCGKGAFGGMLCTRCHHPLELGDHYMRITLDPGDPLLPGIEGAPVFEIVCVGCAAKEALA